MRILVVPNVAVPYDQRMVRSLADAFNSLGHYGVTSPTPLDGPDLAALCIEFAIDVVIQVNRTRDSDCRAMFVISRGFRTFIPTPWMASPKHSKKQISYMR